MKLSLRKGKEPAKQLDPLLQLRHVRYVCVMNGREHSTKPVEEEEQLQKAAQRGKIEVLGKERFREIGQKTAGERLPGGPIQPDKEIVFLLSVLSASAQKGFHQNAEPIKKAFQMFRIFGIP